MKITVDHDVLLKKFYEAQKELNELELYSYKFTRCSSKRGDSNFLNRSAKSNEFWFENDAHFSPTSGLLSKESSHRKRKEESPSSSSDKSASLDEIPIKKVCLQSAVRAVTKTQSKKDVICKQNINKKVRLRNGRILGMLQSTLKKFQDDAMKRKPQDLKRIAVELKVEAARENEKRRLEKEETDLNEKIKGKKLQLVCLEQMLSITESFHEWKCNMKKSLNFILTETEPRIYYLPAFHSVSTVKKFEQSRLEILENIAKQEKEVMNKLTMIMESFEAESFSDEDENEGPFVNTDFN